MTAEARTASAPERHRGAGWWLGRSLRVAALLLAALLATVFLAGTWAKASLRARYPAPGELVDIGGYRLHLDCRGDKAGPTVVFEAGQGDFSLSYRALQAEVASFARVCAYDRAGLGWSERSPLPRSASNVVDELRRLLQAAGEAGPYVLVGHSTGGLHVRLYAYTHPDEVAALVLLDSASEEQFATNPETLDAMLRLMPLYYGLARSIVWLGVPALRPESAPGLYVPANLPTEVAAQYRAMSAASTRTVATASRELASLRETHDELRQARARGLGDLPVILLTHSVCNGCGMLQGEELAAYEENWLAQQQAVAAQSSRGRWQIAEGSGHDVHLDRPDLVVAAVREVLAAAGDR